MNYCTKKIAVIGAGVAGISAAITAAENGSVVTVFEHTEEPLKKLLLTGNKRCNFTNTDVSPIHYHGDSELVKNVLSRFSFCDCIDFYKRLGIEHKVINYRFDKSGYVYPNSESAADVREAFLKRTKELSIKIETGYILEDLPEEYDAYIFACGSNSYPSTGSDGSAYHLIVKAGAIFNTFRPALCALYSKDPYLNEIKGKRIDTAVKLKAGSKTYSSYGEVQFNAHSISGIPVMQLSRYASDELYNKKSELPVLIIDGHEYEIYRTAGFEASQCCIGGVDAACLDKENLNLLTNKNIYFAGEMIDVDGDCGGYNLHFAAATGYIAGLNASTK